MPLSRRNFIGALAGAGGAMGFAACSGGNGKPDQTEDDASRAPENFPALPQSLLVNRVRASDIMKRAGVAAIICSVPRNIYYATNYFPQLSSMGMGGYSFAILPANLKQKPVLIEGQYTFYIAGAERIPGDDIDVRLFTAPSTPDEPTANFLKQVDAHALPEFLPAQHDWHAASDIEARKRNATRGHSKEVWINSHAALVKALQDLQLGNKRLAVDDQLTKRILSKADIVDIDLGGENMLRDIRLQKSAAEIALMRYAANGNAQAGLAAARLVRDGATFQDVRKNYAQECGKRLLSPEFMVIDGVIPDLAAGEIKDGRSFLIDCVSHHQYYHGDYGRTVCVGEPTKEIRKATNAMSAVWDDLLPRLKPGVKYNQISNWAADTFAKTNSGAALICNPHSVGLQHTDEPSAKALGYFEKDNLELMENMVISVDLPMMDVGLGGSAHLEDLVLIKKDGAELLNDGANRVIIV